MNELIFFLHLVFLCFFLAISFRFGERGLNLCIALQAVFANLFVVQQMPFFGLSVTCSDVFSVGSILGLNLLQERFGREAAKSAVRVSFFALLFFVAMSQIHLLYQPIAGDRAAGAFSSILSSSWRTFLSSAVVFYLVQRADVVIYTWLQRWTGRRVRLLTSLLISQLLDTVLFSFLGLYGLVVNIADVIFVSLTVKCLAAITCIGLIPFFRRDRVSV